MFSPISRSTQSTVSLTLKFTTRNYARNVRSHIIAPMIIPETPELYFKRKNEFPIDRVWSKIVKRRRFPVWFKSRKGEPNLLEERSLIDPSRPFQTLGRLKAKKPNAFKTYVYHAIRYDRPDAIIAIGRLFQQHEKAFVARAKLAIGEVGYAERMIKTLSNLPGEIPLRGVISLLIVLGRHEEAKAKLNSLAKRNTGTRKYLYDLVNSPFTSEFKPMLEFANYIDKPAISSLLRIHVIRALIHKHEMDQAIQLFKEHHASLNEAANIVDKFNIAFQKVLKVITEDQLAPILDTIHDIKRLRWAGQDESEAYQKLEQQWEEYSKYFSKGAALAYFHKYLHITAPLVRKIISTGSDDVVRNYFRINYQLVIDAFGDEEADKLESILVRAAKSMKANPDFAVTVMKIRFQVGRKNFAKALELYRDNLKLINDLSPAYHRIIPGLKNIKKKLIKMSDNPEETEQLLQKKKAKSKATPVVAV